MVLLGVVKYFWRDAVARQSAEGKATLKARLTSMTVDGLGISPIRGHTLVYYAKSLVGRDFRTVLQVAPAVLRGMVPEAAYEAWLALCRLAPMVFQNRIDDIEKYKVRATRSVCVWVRLVVNMKTYYRQFLCPQLTTSLERQPCGPHSGSTNQNFTSSSICLTTSFVLVQRLSIQQRHLNCTTSSFACAASTRINMHPASTSHIRSAISMQFVTWSVADTLRSMQKGSGFLHAKQERGYDAF